MRSAPESDPRLLAFLADLTPLGTQRETWLSGAVLEISSYLTDRLPPMDLVTSVRAVVRKGDAVLAFDDPLGGTHIVPGGRLEPGESRIAALTRELREEVGCTAIGDPTLIGSLHLHHVTPRPELYPYPHPDFLQLVYVVQMTGDAVERTDDPFVLRPRFVKFSEIDGLSLPPAERGLLTHPLLEGATEPGDLPRRP